MVVCATAHGELRTPRGIPTPMPRRTKYSSFAAIATPKSMRSSASIAGASSRSSLDTLTMSPTLCTRHWISVREGSLLVASVRGGKLIKRRPGACIRAHWDTRYQGNDLARHGRDFQQVGAIFLRDEIAATSSAVLFHCLYGVVNSLQALSIAALDGEQEVAERLGVLIVRSAQVRAKPHVLKAGHGFEFLQERLKRLADLLVNGIDHRGFRFRVGSVLIRGNLELIRFFLIQTLYYVSPILFP